MSMPSDPNDSPSNTPGGARAHQRVIDLLDSLGAEEREDLEASQRSAVAPGRAERALLAAMREANNDQGSPAHTGRAPRVRLRALQGAALAASLMLAWFLMAYMQDDPPSQDHLAMGSQLELIEPVGIVRDFAAFRFDAELGGDTWARITVRNTDNPDAEPLATSPALRTASWQPSIELTANWKRITWRVELFSGVAAAIPLDSRTAKAERADH